MLIANDSDEPHHNLSSTEHALRDIELFGYRPCEGEADPRPLPDTDNVLGATTDIFDALIATFSHTCMEPDLESLLWSTVNLFHRACERLEQKLDDNEQAQRRSVREQDGSEVRSIELERLVTEGQALSDRRDVLEAMRDQAATLFRETTGDIWLPRSGSRVNRKTLTAAIIDSRDFLQARHRSESAVLFPKGTPIAFAGGQDFNDYRRIWAALDRVHTKHADMVLLHGGSPKGAELIAAKWADTRKVAQVVFKPDWNRHRKAAPFKRNDALLECLPAGLILFPGSGIHENLADKARAMGIAVWRAGGD